MMQQCTSVNLAFNYCKSAIIYGLLLLRVCFNNVLLMSFIQLIYENTKIHYHLWLIIPQSLFWRQFHNQYTAVNWKILANLVRYKIIIFIHVAHAFWVFILHLKKFLKIIMKKDLLLHNIYKILVHDVIYWNT